ncbi:MAG: putative bifunctional diguanylate cyclase/phosphodiesterase [Jatrophihabitans sp.]|uniref:putative bifunctional diguanylate cyclase/phosphodiesterase n=1 Tax=Jatrophihabitans sp. TaxID=1932789 RepID=UPI003F7DB19A
MEPTGGASTSHARPLQSVLRLVTWVLIAVSALVNELVSAINPGDNGQTVPGVLLVAQSAFFLLLLVRLGLALRSERTRRPARVALFSAMVLWMLGSASVASSSTKEFRTFPAPGELLFLAAYAGFAAYLLLDVDWRRQRVPARWLEVLVICGGITCVTALVVAAPIQTATGAVGLPLFLGLLYPLLDLGLAVLVIAQEMSRVRTDHSASLQLAAGMVALAAADSAFSLQVAADRYKFGPISDVLWGVALAFIVDAACRPARLVRTSPPRPTGVRHIVVAAVTAIVVLTVHPARAAEYYVVPPAVLTLLAAGARMILAMREANRAAEAFALSQTDDLTRLPNRRAVRERLLTDITARRPLALMLLDLDGFKEVNDTLGHHAGDTVLRFVAARLMESTRHDAMIARLGGDEFAVIVPSTDEIELLEIGRAVLEELEQPVLVDGIEITPSGSIGIAVRDELDATEGDILRRADVAMYQAKTARSGVMLYDGTFDDFSRPRLQLAEELRRAIADGQIEVWYQPQIEIATLQVRSLEALVRWAHPVDGMRSPATFLPAARRAGLMGALSEHVASTAVQHLRGWLAEGLDLHVAINCAPPELLSHTFLPRLYSSLQTAGVPGDRVVLEVTEDSFLADPHHAREILLQLRSHDIQISIDDYGTGFSSLAYLRDLPVQEIKIDRSFVQAAGTDERSRMIIASTVQLGHALDMRVVAEGAEDEETLGVLADLDVDCVQGYHLARPMPARDIATWINDWQTTATLFARDGLAIGTLGAPDRDDARVPRSRGSWRVVRPHREH